jgi:hypothetical protein
VHRRKGRVCNAEGRGRWSGILRDLINSSLVEVAGLMKVEQAQLASLLAVLRRFAVLLRRSLDFSVGFRVRFEELAGPELLDAGTGVVGFNALLATSCRLVVRTKRLFDRYVSMILLVGCRRICKLTVLRSSPIHLGAKQRPSRSLVAGSWIYQRLSDRRARRVSLRKLLVFEPAQRQPHMPTRELWHGEYIASSRAHAGKYEPQFPGNWSRTAFSCWSSNSTLLLRICSRRSGSRFLCALCACVMMPLIPL